jgi:hypothetical protein
MQLSVSIHSRNIARIDAQNSASARAISGEFEVGDEFFHLEDESSNDLDLLVVSRRSEIPNLISNFMEGEKKVSLQAFAVIENQK